jgi:hypothetical protein
VVALPCRPKVKSHGFTQVGLRLWFSYLHSQNHKCERQSINQNRTLWHPGPLTCGKPPCAAPFLHASWFQSYMCESAEQTKEQCSCCLVKTTALITLQELEDLPHLPIATNPVIEGTKSYSQAKNLVRPNQSSSLYTNTRIRCLRNNSRTFTKRLNFLFFLYLVFFTCFFFSILLTSPSLLSYPHFLTSITFSPFPVLQSIVFPPNYSFCPYSSTHSMSSPPLSILPQSVTTLLLPSAHSPPTD